MDSCSSALGLAVRCAAGLLNTFVFFRSRFLQRRQCLDGIIELFSGQFKLQDATVGVAETQLTYGHGIVRLQPTTRYNDRRAPIEILERWRLLREHVRLSVLRKCAEVMSVYG
jgi:hypothetical protein